MPTFKTRTLGEETLGYYTITELFAEICRRSEGAILSVNPLAKKEPDEPKFMVFAHSARTEVSTALHGWVLARRACQHLRPDAEKQVDLSLIEESMREFGSP